MTFSLLLLAGALCGIIMILGGILLLYKGAISLWNVSGEDAFTLEYKNELRISTQYPALGIFIIGLMFVTFSLVIGKPEHHRLVIKGIAQDMDQPVTIRLKASSWVSGRAHNGEVLETFYPNMDILQIEVTAPGYNPLVKPIAIDASDIEADLGQFTMDLSVEKPVVSTEVSGRFESELSTIPQATFGGTL